MKEITALTLEKMEQEFDANAAHKLAMNAATKSGITTLLRDADLEKRERFSFSIDLEAYDACGSYEEAESGEYGTEPELYAVL